MPLVSNFSLFRITTQISLVRADPGRLTALDALRRNFTFCEISMLGCLRKQYEDKCNRSRVRLASFLLVRRLESVDWGSARLPRRGDFLPMIEEGHERGTNHLRLGNFTLRFRFGWKVKTRRKHNYGLQQINLVAFRDIPRASHPTKEIVPVVPRG